MNESDIITVMQHPEVIKFMNSIELLLGGICLGLVLCFVMLLLIYIENKRGE